MKKSFLCAVVTLAILGITSCVSSAPIVWDESVPEDETASVYFYYLTPASYNGVNVEWKSLQTVKIPGGDAEFSLKVASNNYSIPDAVFSYYFERGAEYTVAFGTKEVEGGRLIVGVDVYEGIGVVKESALLAFVPFSNIN